MTKAILLALTSLVPLTGCAIAARSPDTYRDDTSKVLWSKNEAIRSCYDAVLRATPTAQGRVTVKFDVETEQGRISHVTVDGANTTAPGSVSECVTKNIDGLVLAPPDKRKGEAVWAYDFRAAPAPRVPGST